MTETWMSSHELMDALSPHRDNDVKVQLEHSLVPISGICYRSDADSIVINLVDGDDLRLERAGWTDLTVLAQFQVLTILDEFLTIQCEVCDLMLGFENPHHLSDLVGVATDHAKVCR